MWRHTGDVWRWISVINIQSPIPDLKKGKEYKYVYIYIYMYIYSLLLYDINRGLAYDFA